MLIRFAHSNGYAPAFLLTLIFVAIAVISRSVSYINHDTSWLLYLTSQYLDGAELYVDVVETNPPFIIWITAPAVWMAKLTGLSLAVMFKTLVFLLAGGSTSVSALIMRKIKVRNWSYVIPVIAFVFMLLPGYDFGQREHLLVLFTFPYLLVILARVDDLAVSKHLVFIAAIMGVCGFLIKPHFVSVPIALELYLFYKIGLKKTFLRPEPYILGFSAILYLCVVVFYTPAYFSRVIIYAAEVYGTGFNASILYLGVRLVIPMCLLLLARNWINAHGREHISNFFMVFLISSLAMFAMYALQGKGWTYHIYPGFAYLIIALMSLLIASWRTVFAKHNSSLITYVFSAAIIGTSVYPAMSFKYDPAALLQWDKVVDDYPDTESIFIMSANVFHGFPLVTERDLIWGSRFACLWMLPGLKIKQQEAGSSSAMLTEIESYTRHAVAEDIARYKPDLIFVDVQENKHYFRDIKFNYLEDFSNNVKFTEQWKSYNKVDFANGFDIYQRRSDGSANARTIPTLDTKPYIR